nr:MAG TPA: antitoxin [Caudoviricetes sp.]
MQQSAQNNLFTTFNNIEKIKKEKQERKVKPVIRVEKMIKTIKEHYNLNAPMLAHNLGVDVQAIYRWEKGGRPNIKRYNKIKELYEEIIRENKTEALEQPETALKPLEITNKDVTEDVTAGTPFITLTGVGNSGKFIINANRINKMKFYLTCTEIHINEEYIRVKESPAEIFELIRKNSKENEKN